MNCEEYEEEEDKNEFILVEFSNYIDDAGNVASRKKLIGMINDLMREGRSGVQETLKLNLFWMKLILQVCNTKEKILQKREENSRNSL